MSRPKGLKQARNENKYWLPEGVSLLPNQSDDYVKDTPLLFNDKAYGEFKSTFKALQTANASTHPEAKHRRKCLVQQRVHSDKAMSVSIREKAQATYEKKTGFKHALQNPAALTKCQTTLQQNYNVNTPMKSSLIREKQRQSLIGSIGYDNPMKCPAVKEKVRKIMVDEGYTLPLSNGLTISQMLIQYNLPHLTYAYDLRNSRGDEAAIAFIEHYKENKTDNQLELMFRTLLPEAEPFGKTVPATKRKFKPDFKYKDFYIEIDGLYPHSEALQPNKNHHLEKREVFAAAGLNIIQIREHELLYKAEIVKSIILTKAGEATTTIFARKCDIRAVSPLEARGFLNDNHLMGEHRASRHFGLYYQDSLVSMMSYNVKKDGVLDISRFCSKLFTIVVGGLSKLLKHIETLEDNRYSVVTYFVDLRYGSGESVKQMGFTLENITLGYGYTDYKTVYHRSKCRASENMSEEQLAKERKWYKIYDAGQAKYVREKQRY